MITTMHRVAVVLSTLTTAAVASGCGGGANHAPTLEHPALPTPTSDSRFPYRAVGACSGPAGGRAGTYVCVTTPRGRHGIRSITVRVRRDGEWSTQPLTIDATLHGHRTTAATAVWGTGIRVPD